MLFAYSYISKERKLCSTMKKNNVGEEGHRAGPEIGSHAVTIRGLTPLKYKKVVNYTNPARRNKAPGSGSLPRNLL